jgi:hypothetical protein
MGVPTSEVGYTSATAGRGDHEVYKGHVVALGKKNKVTYVSINKLTYLLHGAELFLGSKSTNFPNFT